MVLSQLYHNCIRDRRGDPTQIGRCLHVHDSLGFRCEGAANHVLPWYASVVVILVAALVSLSILKMYIVCRSVSPSTTVSAATDMALVITPTKLMIR